MNRIVTVKYCVDVLGLEVISGQDYLEREVSRTVLSRPNVEIYADYFTYYEHDRIQIIGNKEINLLSMVEVEKRHIRLEQLFSPGPPAFIFTHDTQEIPQEFIDLSEKYHIPLLKAQYKTTTLIGLLSNVLIEAKAIRKSIHGVLMNIRGVGVLIKGKNFVGKSEAALELLHRGHILISDDRVEAYENEIGSVIGEAPELTRRLMEVRGLGLIDVVDLFGVGAFQPTKEIMLIVELVKWDQTNPYSQMGLAEESEQICDTMIPKMIIPVQPGRNLATLIEVAAMNWRMKTMGRNVTQEFVDKISALNKGDKK